MRVVHVLEAVGGGTSVHLRSLAVQQARDGHHVAVVVPRRRALGLSDEAFIDDVSRSGVDVHVVAMHSIPVHPRNIGAARSLSRFLESWRPDIVHSHSTAAGAVARPVARRHRIPTVHTPHGVQFADERRSVAWYAALALEKGLSPLTKRVIALSASEARALERAYETEKISVVANGLEATPGPTPPFPAKRRIVAVNRFVYQKDPELAVRVMALVRQQLPDVEAVVVGDGPLRDRVRSMVDAIDPAIRLVGDGDGRTEITKATVVLLTSRWEGAPYVPLEAMNAGRPVVATDVVGTRDVVVDASTGYLFDPSRPELAAQRLIELLGDDRMTDAFGSAGRARLESCYRPQQMTDGVGKLYREVVDRAI